MIKRESFRFMKTLFFLFVSLCAALVPSASAVEAVAINATTELADVSRRPIGINTNYLVDSERARPGAPERTTAAAIQEMRMKYLRYPGGEKSDSYLWSVAPWTSAKPTLARTGPNEWPANSRQFTTSNDGTWIAGKEPLDFDEFMTIAKSTGAEPVIVVCYDAMYKALTTGGTRPTKTQLITSAAEWVRYANVTKGYGVKYWSIGNETDYNADGNPGSAQYATDLIDFSNAMKAIDPTIKIGAQGQTAGWFQTVLTRAADKIDFLDVHEYAGAGWTGDYETFRNNYQNFAGNAEMAIGAINSYAPAAHRDRLKVIVSEIGAHSFTGGWPGRNDMGHALVLFEQIGQHVRKPKVDFVQYWNTRWTDNDNFELPPGTTNLLSNPGFENDLADWTSSDASPGNSSVTMVAGEIHSGGKAVKVSGATGGGRRRNITALLSRNTVYTFKTWAKVSGTAAWSGAGIAFYKNGTKIRNLEWTIDNTAGYEEYSRSFRTSGDYDDVELSFYKNGGTDTLFLDDFSITTGGIPNSFTAIGAKNEIFPSGRVLAIWGEYLQDKVLSTATTASVLVHASRSPATNRLTVFLSNKQTSAKETVLTLKNYPGAPVVAKRRVLKGTSATDFMPTWTAEADCPVGGDKISLTLPPLSITVLDLVPAPVVKARASAAPNPLMKSAATELSVLADDDAGEALLTYTWSSVGDPPAAVAFSANGTNAAKQVSANFTEPGSYQFLVTVTDGNGLSVTDTLTVEVVQSFALWKQSRFSASELGDPALSGAAADADGDGAPNLCEYARGSDPRVFDPAMIAGYLAGNFSLNYSKDTTKPGVAMAVQHSTDLQGWSDAGIIHDLVADGAIQLLKATIPAATPCRFLRIKVTEK